jgi:hypothetical protein
LYQFALAEAKFEECPWHCRRHTFAGQQVMNTCPLAGVSRLGYGTISQTMVYRSLQPDSAAQAVVDLMKAYETPTGTSTV